jgi:hypothetical protein
VIRNGKCIEATLQRKNTYSVNINDVQCGYWWLVVLHMGIPGKRGMTGV